MKQYLETLRGIFDPVALFIRDEEFIIVVKDEMDINEKVNQLNESIDDDMSLIILSKEEFEKMNKDELGERLL
ncbi:MAG TPA: hypothetical protein PL174_04940 [Fervidobacterium sp.]|jgi:hypothetical protein|nr:hypothetical protein [Fervidobacterium sp.]NLH37015.1 hypothetical protein [Thermotogaceae bacterium]MBP9518550.1 hypothetical protein [Fervidobacterium sp.]HCL98966.1 hypothetical protein [Fervidobacterium sp.]HOA16908.1 hypothetical protein [Fervidobacterium sp.]